MSLGNLSPTERWVSALAGFGLMLGAVTRGGLVRRLTFAASGATLMSRGLTGYCGMKAALNGETSIGSGMREQWQRMRAQVGAAAAGIDTLEALHLEALQELASSTGQLAALLYELEQRIEHPELAKQVRSYATQLNSREQDLERIITSRGASPHRHPDQAMQGLIEEARKMTRIATAAVRDAALIDSLQRIVHYQIAAGGSAAAHAKALGRDADASRFAEWADRDKAIDQALTGLAKEALNPLAAGRGTVEAAGTPEASRTSGPELRTH